MDNPCKPFGPMSDPMKHWDQAGIGPDLDPNCLTPIDCTFSVLEHFNFEEKISTIQMKKECKITQHTKS